MSANAKPDETLNDQASAWVARLAALYYFAFVWLILPIVGLIETPKKLPASIAQSVLGDSAAAAAE